MKLEDFSTENIQNTPEFSEWLLGVLKNECATITFTKKDGTERVMRCTKNLDNIPSDKRPTGKVELSESENIRVFDMDKNEWRSFNKSSVKRVEFTIGGK